MSSEDDKNVKDLSQSLKNFEFKVEVDENGNLVDENGKPIERKGDDENEEEETTPTTDVREELEKDNINEIPQEDRDQEMEEFAAKFKHIYETKFRDYLRELKDQSISLSATGLPASKYNKETFEEDSNNSTTLMFHFDKIEMDKDLNINVVHMLSADRTEKCQFTPFKCKNYGPYYDTTLFTSLYLVGRLKMTTEHFFLDLPVDLYNLIEE